VANLFKHIRLNKENRMKIKRRRISWKWTIAFSLLILSGGLEKSSAGQVGDDSILGPHSKEARGELRVLMAAVKFPDVEPRFPLERTRKRVVEGLNQYVQEQSYGRAWIKADFRAGSPCRPHRTL